MRSFDNVQEIIYQASALVTVMGGTKACSDKWQDYYQHALLISRVRAVFLINGGSFTIQQFG